MGESHRASKREERSLIAVIAEEDTVIGFLLAGVGKTDYETNENNFAIVTPGTTDEDLNQIFFKIYNRSDIGVLFIEDSLAARLNVKNLVKAMPILLEIPGKTSFE